MSPPSLSTVPDGGLRHQILTKLGNRLFAMADSFYSVDMPVEILRPRAHRAVFISIIALTLFTLAQVIAFGYQGEGGVLDPVAGAVSIGLNLFSLFIVLIFYMLNYVLAERLGWDVQQVYRVSIYSVFTVFMLIVLAHISLAGSSCSLMPIMLVDMTLLNCWLAGYRQAWVYFFTGVLSWMGIWGLENLGALPFMPLHARRELIPLEIFLEPRYFFMNVLLFAFFGGFIVYLVMYYQRQVQLQNEELDRKNHQLKENNEQLLSLERLRDHLTEMIVHDLRSPLAGVTLNLQSAMRNLPRDAHSSTREKLDRVHAGIQAQLEMINSLLDVNRLESGQLELEKEPTDLEHLFRSAMDTLSGLVTDQKLSIMSEPGVPWVICDPDIISRVISNLLGNALKFTPPNGSIDLMIRVNPRVVVVSVRDSGPGIPEEYHKKIFEKFGQAEIRGNRRMYSTGLGLAFCKLAIEAHGGSIGVTSELGKGSTFWFSLPLQPHQLTSEGGASTW